MKALKKWAWVGLAALGLLGFIMIFLPAVRAELLLSAEYGGLKAVFGSKDDHGNVITKFNFLGLLAFMLPLAAAVVAVVLREHKLGNLISCCLFLLAIVFFALFGVGFRGANDVNSNIAVSLLVGPILGIVFSVLGLGLAGTVVALDYFKK